MEGQVDHTLLAKATGELSGRRDALAKEIAALDEEIERKGPLAASATTLSTRVAELEDQLLRLTREREQAAAAVRDARHQLDLVQADRAVAEREHARLAKQVNALDARKEETEAALASLNAEVRQQDSVFATLEVLKKEQGFLRELIGAMLDDGSAARERIRELRQESETLLAAARAGEGPDRQADRDPAAGQGDRGQEQVTGGRRNRTSATPAPSDLGTEDAPAENRSPPEVPSRVRRVGSGIGSPLEGRHHHPAGHPHHLGQLVADEDHGEAPG